MRGLVLAVLLLVGCESLPDEEEVEGLKDLGDTQLSENCKFDVSKEEVRCECRILAGRVWCNIIGGKRG
ncbi:hypothetical protein CMI47_04565 [Candidatus Pacearchaeota archaeon]|nr:hypothetical protein [Candidatus Pacearchaeota archaeon]